MSPQAARASKLARSLTSLCEKAASHPRLPAAGDCHDFAPQWNQQVEMEPQGARLADCPPTTVFTHTLTVAAPS